MSTITVLTAKVPATKQYYIVDEKITKGQILTPKVHDSHTVDVTNLDELYTVLEYVRTDPHKYVIRAAGNEDVMLGIQRTLENFKDLGSEWVCFDFDEAIVPGVDPNSMEAVEHLIKNNLPENFKDASYIYQWSSSSGLFYNDIPAKIGTNIHLFFWIDRAFDYNDFKKWFAKYTDKEVTNHIDQATLRSITGIYVGSHSITEEGIIDVIPADKKFGMVKKDNDVVITPNKLLFDSAITQKSRTDQQYEGISGEDSDRIIQRLFEVGAVYRDNGKTLELQHPNEKSRSYFVFRENPELIHHQGRGTRSVYDWLKEFFHDDLERPTRPTEKGLGDFITQFKAKRRLEVIDREPLMIFDDWHENAVQPYSREKRADLLKRRCLKDWKGVMLLYAFEGFGKSYLATMFCKKRGKKVLFASISNTQAAEQAEGFREQGLNVQFIAGQEYLMRSLYGIQPESKNNNNPWEGASIDKEATELKLLESGWTKAKIDEMWEATKSPDPDWSHDIICTTSRRVSSWGKIQKMKSFMERLTDDKKIIPRDTVVFYDDPDVGDFMSYAPWKDEYNELFIDNKKVARKDINDRSYAIRPDKYMVGYGLYDVNVIFTTTELLTSALIKRQYGESNVYSPKLMPDEKMNAGDITMIKSELARKKNDGFLTPMIKRLKKENYDIELIGDGVGSNINMVNNKGQNGLVDKDTIVKVSMPNPYKVTHFLDELGWDKGERNQVAQLIALDTVQQAIGRNSGYRWSDRQDNDRQCVVVCEPQLFNVLIKRMRYYVKTVLDNPIVGVKREYRTLRDAVVWYIENMNRYVISGLDKEKKAFINDVKSLMNDGDYSFKVQKVIVLDRILNSLNERASNKKISLEYRKKFADVIGEVTSIKTKLDLG